MKKCPLCGNDFIVIVEEALGVLWWCDRCKIELEGNFSGHYWPKGDKQMQEDFDKSIEFVLRMEGGYSNDLYDRGGETNFGISQRSYPSLDIKNLTVEQAKEIYKRDFWAPCRCDEIPFPFAISLFDAAVNQGVTTSKRMLQRALNVFPDGIFGPLTMEAINKAGKYHLKRFLAERLMRYTAIIANDGTQSAFSLNWSMRIINLGEIVLMRQGD